MDQILITGGAGFIGSHFVRYALDHSDACITILDKLTYAGNIARLADCINDQRIEFIQGDIADFRLVEKIFNDKKITKVINFAAETHVDRSISGPEVFIHSNINGVYTLLEVARKFWQNKIEKYKFLQVSTDEVFGEMELMQPPVTEEACYRPRSPYSATKASADHLVKAWHVTYELPVNISYCSNNFGPHQHEEKFIPKSIMNALAGTSIPVYGNGRQIRDWLYVEDHCSALWLILEKGKTGESYNISVSNELRNISLLEKICDLIDSITLRPTGTSRALIKFVADRPGHDKRYAINSSKIQEELGWKYNQNFDEKLMETILWYTQYVGEECESRRR